MTINFSLMIDSSHLSEEDIISFGNRLSDDDITEIIKYHGDMLSDLTKSHFIIRLIDIYPERVERIFDYEVDRFLLYYYIQFSNSLEKFRLYLDKKLYNSIIFDVNSNHVDYNILKYIVNNNELLEYSRNRFINSYINKTIDNNYISDYIDILSRYNNIDKILYDEVKSKIETKDIYRNIFIIFHPNFLYNNITDDKNYMKVFLKEVVDLIKNIDNDSRLNDKDRYLIKKSFRNNYDEIENIYNSIGDISNDNR